jgi:spore coat protein CotH
MFINSVYREESGRTFFNRFFDDPVFRAKYKERWNARYEDIVGMDAFIDEMAALLSESQKVDSAVWHWWEKRNEYGQEIENMKTWWRKRAAYLHEEINKF